MTEFSKPKFWWFAGLFIRLAGVSLLVLMFVILLGGIFVGTRIDPAIWRGFFTVLLLTGYTWAILNVLVAWGCVLWSPYKHFVSPPEKADNTMPADIVGPDNSLGWWRTATGFGVFESEPWAARVYDETHFDSWRSKLTPAFYRCGWPMYSMQSLVTHYEATDGHYLAGQELPHTEIVHRGFQTSKLPAWLHAQEERRLPIVPLWFGFVCNTAIYFFVLLGLWFALERLRKRNFISAPA